MTSITHVTFDMRIGGAEKVIYNLIRGMEDKEIKTSILCLEKQIGPFGKSLVNQGYKISNLERQPGFDTQLIIDIHNYIKQNKIDILHCHQYTPYVYGVLGALFTGCKVIFTEHGRFYPDIRKQKRVIINPLLNKITHKITAISNATKNALVQYENFPEKDIEVVYNGIEINDDAIAIDKEEFKRSLNLPQDSMVLGTVARLDPIKNHLMMIKGLKEILIKCPNTYLVIVGDGPERERLGELTESLGMKSHVIFTGFREDTAQFYSIFDIFLLTSFSEGTAMTLLESMAAGLPSIVTDVGGNPEITENNKTGFVIKSDDVNEYVDKACLLLGNESLRRSYGEAGKIRFSIMFTLKAMVDSYERIYREILED